MRARQRKPSTARGTVSARFATGKAGQDGTGKFARSRKQEQPPQSLSFMKQEQGLAGCVASLRSVRAAAVRASQSEPPESQIS